MSPSEAGEAGIDEARGVPGARATAGDAALPVALPPFGVARLPRIVFGAGRRAEIPALVATFGRRALPSVAPDAASTDRTLLPGQVAVVSDDHGPVLLVRVRDVRQLAAVPGLSPAL